MIFFPRLKLRKKFLSWNSKENWEQGQEISKEMENLEPDNTAVFYFIPKYLFFYPKWCDFLAFLSWMNIARSSCMMMKWWNLRYLSGPKYEFELTFVWAVRSFSWPISTVKCAILFCVGCIWNAKASLSPHHSSPGPSLKLYLQWHCQKIDMSYIIYAWRTVTDIVLYFFGFCFIL